MSRHAQGTPPRAVRHRASADMGTESGSAISALSAYAVAFAAGHYTTMWDLLTPAARAGWGGPAGYAAYYRRKFAPVLLRDIALTPSHGPGQAAQSARVVRIPLTLDLAWRHGGAPGAPGALALLCNLDATVVRAGAGWRVDDGGPLDARAPIIPPPGSPTSAAVRVPILMYHHISNLPPLALSQVDLTVTARDFAAQLAYLAGHGYRAITLVDLFNTLYYGRPLPPRPVILTFDDGYADNYTDAFPLLRRYGMVGEFNIVTGLVGTTLGVNTYVTWPQVEAMAAAGMEMESHTVSHPDLGRINAARDDYELHFSRAVLAGHIHRAVQFMAYPSGEPFRSGTPVAQARVRAILARYGYVGALLDPIAPGTAQDAAAPYQLPRVRVRRSTTLAQFAAGLRL